MYNLKFTSEVSEKVLNDLRSKTSKRDGWRLARVEEIEYSTMEVWTEFVERMIENPFGYHELSENIFLATELYIPFVLLYTVKDNDIIIFKALTRDELFPA